MKLLHLDSSPLGDASVSRTLTKSIVDAWKHNVPELEVVYRDLAADPVAHLSGSVLQAVFAADTADLSADQRAERELSDALIAEFLSADVVVVGAPMYNFSVPTQLKAWIDRISKAGVTFRYTETGPVGLAGGRKVVIASSRGSIYGESGAMAALDHQEAYLKTFFGFLGITDVTVFHAEGVGLGPEARTAAIANAKDEIKALLQPVAA